MNKQQWQYLARLVMADKNHPIAPSPEGWCDELLSILNDKIIYDPEQRNLAIIESVMQELDVIDIEELLGRVISIKDPLYTWGDLGKCSICGLNFIDCTCISRAA